MGRIEKEFDDLRFELQHHPLLLTQVNKATNIYQVLETVATHCNVMLDGAYAPDQLLELAKILTNKLYISRTILVVRG